MKDNGTPDDTLAFRDTSAFRDEELGQALRGLPVPEHETDFFARLGARLEAEERNADDRRGERTGQRRESRRWWRLLLLPIPLAAAILALVWIVGWGRGRRAWGRSR